MDFTTVTHGSRCWALSGDTGSDTDESDADLLTPKAEHASAGEVPIWGPECAFDCVMHRDRDGKQGPIRCPKKA